VVCLDQVIRILPDGVQRRGNQLVQDPRVDGRAVGRDLDGHRADAHRLGEEAPRGGQVTPGRQQDADDLATLIHCPI
jgi:hypothetical protein